MVQINAIGGYDAVGRNMTCVTAEGKRVMIDNGIRLDTMQIYDREIQLLKRKNPADLMRFGVLPDPANIGAVDAQLISHGHLDHIGALPFTEPKCPIVSTPYTVEVGRAEYAGGDFYSIGYNDLFEISPDISAEFVEVTHSIPYSSIVVLHTPNGDIVYASDFRFDNNSTISRPDYQRLKEIGNGDVLALIVESTRSAVGGKTPSEAVVRQKLKDVFEFIGDEGLILATTFATHVERIQAILDEVEKSGRIPLILGRSLVKNIELAKRFGLIDLPFNTVLLREPRLIKKELRDMRRRNEYFILATGHQGEPDAVLSKIVDGRFPFKLQKNDSTLFCANVIPTPLNRATRFILETKLRAFGVRIFDDLHVSGHASCEDHRKLLSMLKPRHIIPCHGSLDMRSAYARLACGEGYTLNEDVHLLLNGDVVNI